jgi:hypothetical protein
MSTDRSIETYGYGLLNSMTVSASMKTVYAQIKDYSYNVSHSQDREIWLTCVLAMQSVALGNFGVGSIITDTNNTL